MMTATAPFRFQISTWIIAGLLYGFAQPTSAQSASIADLFEQVGPSVVLIRTTETYLPPDGPRRRIRASGLGSGILISEDGLILTAAHVVHTADGIAVEFQDGFASSAHVVGTYPTADIALIRLKEFPPEPVTARLGDSDDVRVGEQIVVIGAPYGLNHSLSVGHIGGRLRSGGQMGFQSAELFQTDAAINKGNSGGPMVNMQGEVIGVVSHILSQGGGFEGLGFAVTSNLARELLLENPSIWSGLEMQLIEGELARALNVPQERAILVQKVAAESPAARLGLQAGTVRATIEGQELLIGGDILLAVLDIPLLSADALSRAMFELSRLQPEDQVTVRILRAGEIIEISRQLEPDLRPPSPYRLRFEETEE